MGHAAGLLAGRARSLLIELHNRAASLKRQHESRVAIRREHPKLTFQPGRNVVKPTPLAHSHSFYISILERNRIGGCDFEGFCDG